MTRAMDLWQMGPWQRSIHDEDPRCSLLNSSPACPPRRVIHTLNPGVIHTLNPNLK